MKEYRACSSDGIRDVWVVGNPSKEWNNWKGECEDMKRKWSALQKELVGCRGIKLDKALQEEAKFYGFP